MRWFTLLLLASLLHADDLTQKMTARVSEEAEAFSKIATDVLSTETLHQTAKRRPSRFHPRVGAAPVAPGFQDREIVSEYGFAKFAGESEAIHEVRQVISVDGKKIQDTKKAQDALAKAITSNDDGQKKALLKSFEQYGLQGAVTDFGQIILLFTRRDIERYEFTSRGTQMVGADRALVFAYKQIDGSEALTLFQENKKDQPARLKMEGELRVREADFVPLQITLATHLGDGPNAIREEAAVTYKMSPFGILLPSATDHRELRGGHVVAENHFTYSDFHKFGASSDLKFDAK